VFIVENEVIIVLSIVINNHSDSNIAAGTFILSYVRREDLMLDQWYRFGEAIELEQ